MHLGIVVKSEPNMKLLLLSSSKTHEQPKFLENALPWLKEFFSEAKTILFVPYALKDYDAIILSS